MVKCPRAPPIGSQNPITRGFGTLRGAMSDKLQWLTYFQHSFIPLTSYLFRINAAVLKQALKPVGRKSILKASSGGEKICTGLYLILMCASTS